MSIKRLIVLCVVIMSTTSLWADVFYTDIETLAKLSFDIVEGEVLKIDQKWDQDHISIYTYITIRLLTSHKNLIEADEIIIKDIGGRLDGYTTLAQCQAKYSVGENVLIFLQKEGTLFRTYGLNKGKFSVKIINEIKYLIRDINPEELHILGKKVKKDDIKREFTYSEMDSLISVCL